MKTNYGNYQMVKNEQTKKIIHKLIYFYRFLRDTTIQLHFFNCKYNYMQLFDFQYDYKHKHTIFLINFFRNKMKCMQHLMMSFIPAYEACIRVTMN